MKSFDQKHFFFSLYSETIIWKVYIQMFKKNEAKYDMFNLKSCICVRR